MFQTVKEQNYDTRIKIERHKKIYSENFLVNLAPRRVCLINTMRLIIVCGRHFPQHSLYFRFQKMAICKIWKDFLFLLTLSLFILDAAEMKIGIRFLSFFCASKGKWTCDIFRDWRKKQSIFFSLCKLKFLFWENV